MSRPLLLGTLALLSALAPAAQDGAATAPDALPESHILERVYVAGASVSDGFGLSKDLKTRVKLAHVFQAACRAEGAHFLPLGDTRFFLDPRTAGERIIATAIEGEATCFIGLDFLFWYAYGIKSEKLRLAYMEDALESLERLECPILLGDLPDMTIALKGSYFGRPMLTPEMIPTKETLATINRILQQWVLARENAHIVPMASLLKQIQGGEVIRLRNLTYEPKNLRELLQSDLLHLTAEGSIALCLLTGDVLIERFKSVQAEDFVFDRERSMQRLVVIAERLREAEQTARDARREERRHEREERRKRPEEDASAGVMQRGSAHQLRAAS